MIKKNLFFLYQTSEWVFRSFFPNFCLYVNFHYNSHHCFRMLFQIKKCCFLKRLSDRTTLFDMMLFVNLRSEKLFSSKLKPYQIESFYLLTCVSQPNMFIQVICLRCMINFSYAFRHDVDKQSTFLF